MTVLVHKMLRLTTVVKCSSKTVSEVETWPIYVSVMGQTGAEQPTHPDTNPVSVQITCFRNRGGVPNSSEPADGSLERFQWRPLKLKSFFEGQRQTAPRQKRRSQGYPWRNVPYGARRSSRRWNPGTGSRERVWGEALTEALLTAEEQERGQQPSLTSWPAHSTESNTVEPWEERRAQDLTNKVFKIQSILQTNSWGHRSHKAVDANEEEMLDWQGQDDNDW